MYIPRLVTAITLATAAAGQDLLGNLLGTLDAPTLPISLGYGSNHWGNASQVDPYNNIPNTGRTRYYNLHVSRKNTSSPDGFEKELILINGQFPGPLIEANWGDTIQVTVTNDIRNRDEGLTMHWHGQRQKLSPWADGVPSVSHCPIVPGGSFTYKFRAESFGTSWYHSHISAQYSDGLYGPLVIHGPSSASYDVDLGPIMLQDYFHTSYYDILLAGLTVPTNIIGSDNNLINGRGIYNCTTAKKGSNCQPYAHLSKFRFQQGKTHRLRLINPGSSAVQKFTIDGYTMTVIANDYVPVEPYETKVVTLGVGQRTDVLVKATGKPTDAVWMRSEIDASCDPIVSGPLALAAIYYPHADTRKLPNTTATPWSSNNCMNDPLNQTVPAWKTTPPPQPAATQELSIDVHPNATGILLFYVNNSTFRGNYNYPLLQLANAGNTSYPDDPQWNVYNFKEATSVRLVVYNYWIMGHPMHLHGHDFWVIDEGFGKYDGSKVVRPSNPQRRDSHLMAPGSADTPSYMVIEFNTDNPGVWPFHCHIVDHVGAGFYVNIMTRPDLIKKQNIPAAYKQTCATWSKWQQNHFVDEIDSGLRFLERT